MSNVSIFASISQQKSDDTSVCEDEVVTVGERLEERRYPPAQLGDGLATRRMKALESTEERNSAGGRNQMTYSGGNYNEMSKNHTIDEGLEAMITGSPSWSHVHRPAGIGKGLADKPTGQQITSQERFRKLVSTYKPRRPRQTCPRDVAYQGDGQCSAT